MSSTAGSPISIALCGDVMTARGVDQILPHPGDPRLHESYVSDAPDYVALTKENSGAFPIPADFDYIRGDALPALRECDVRIVNLEKSITRTGEPAPAKGIHYRMHPSNAGCLTAARLDCCGLANNAARATRAFRGWPSVELNDHGESETDLFEKGRVVRNEDEPAVLGPERAQLVIELHRLGDRFGSGGITAFDRDSAARRGLEEFTAS